MQTFYFHILTAYSIERDRAGMALSGPDELHRHARHVMLDAALKFVRRNIEPSNCSLVVEDEEGRTVLMVSLSELENHGAYSTDRIEIDTKNPARTNTIG